MRDEKGRFIKGVRYSEQTEFKKGEHWRKRKPYWDKDWLYNSYVSDKKSAKEIADEFSITEAAILYWIRKHEIITRSMSEIRNMKHWGLDGKDNPMYGKRGKLNHNWKGGCTPERQKFYQTEEWKSVLQKVWKRDNATCRMCGIHQSDEKDKFHIHHIVSFSNRDLRCDLDNLVLVCKGCHNFIHSNENKERRFLG